MQDGVIAFCIIKLTNSILYNQNNFDMVFWHLCFLASVEKKTVTKIFYISLQQFLLHFTFFSSKLMEFLFCYQTVHMYFTMYDDLTILIYILYTVCTVICKCNITMRFKREQNKKYRKEQKSLFY